MEAPRPQCLLTLLDLGLFIFFFRRALYSARFGVLRDGRGPPLTQLPPFLVPPLQQPPPASQGLPPSVRLSGELRVPPPLFLRPAFHVPGNGIACVLPFLFYVLSAEINVVFSLSRLASAFFSSFSVLFFWLFCLFSFPF